LCLYLVQKYEKNAVANDKCVFSTCTKFTYNHSLQPTILNDKVNQFKVGLESDKELFHIKSQDNDVDMPLFLPAIVLALDSTVDLALSIIIYHTYGLTLRSISRTVKCIKIFLKTKFVGNFMLYNFCNNSKCHLEQRKRGIYKKPIFATFDLQYLDSCTRVHEPFEPTYKMSKQRFIQVCGLLSFILRFTPFFTLYLDFEGYADIFVCVISRRTSNRYYYVLCIETFILLLEDCSSYKRLFVSFVCCWC
jgi:hypothetical protein